MIAAAMLTTPGPATATPGLSVDLKIDWATESVKTRTAATIEVDVMPFLGRTKFGGPFDAVS